MRVALLGAGAVALGNAALLSSRGHQVVVWSPTGNGAPIKVGHYSIEASGAIEGRIAVEVATTAAEAMSGANVVIVAVPAYAYKFVLDAAAPHIRSNQPVIVSGHLSFGALYLAKRMAELGSATVPIAAFGTTVTTGRRTGVLTVNVKTVRSKLDMAALPANRGEEMIELCQNLFGDRFVLRSNLLAVSLSNLNPLSHMAVALCNFTRIERGERWDQDENLTDAVGRLIEALDAERLAISDAAGVAVRTVREHFHHSFQVPLNTVGAMSRELSQRKRNVLGPTTLETRYILEDVPFGLVPTILLARAAGVSAPLHEAGLKIFSALYGRDFHAANDILPALRLEELSIPQLMDLVVEGFSG